MKGTRNLLFKIKRDRFLYVLFIWDRYPLYIFKDFMVF